MKDFNSLLQNNQSRNLSYDSNDRIEEAKRSAFINDTSKGDEIIFRQYMGASVFYGLLGDKFSLLRANEEYYRLTNIEDSIQEEKPGDILANLPEEERLKVLAICKKSKAGRRPLNCIVKQPLKNAQRTLLFDINYIVNVIDKEIYFIHIVDMQ